MRQPRRPSSLARPTRAGAVARRRPPRTTEGTEVWWLPTLTGIRPVRVRPAEADRYWPCDEDDCYYRAGEGIFATEREAWAALVARRERELRLASARAEAALQAAFRAGVGDAAPGHETTELGLLEHLASLRIAIGPFLDDDALAGLPPNPAWEEFDRWTARSDAVGAALAPAVAAVHAALDGWIGHLRASWEPGAVADVQVVEAAARSARASLDAADAALQTTPSPAEADLVATGDALRTCIATVRACIDASADVGSGAVGRGPDAATRLLPIEDAIHRCNRLWATVRGG